jgi:hypothetical protein
MAVTVAPLVFIFAVYNRRSPSAGPSKPGAVFGAQNVRNDVHLCIMFIYILDIF